MKTLKPDVKYIKQSFWYTGYLLKADFSMCSSEKTKLPDQDFLYLISWCEKKTTRIWLTLDSAFFF